MNASRRSILQVCLLALAVVCATAPARAAGAKDRLSIETASGRHAFSVEVAATPQQREIGLMYRRELAPDHAMLFDFERTEPVGMWMQNTYVALDMVFVRPDGVVQRVEADTEPLSTRVIHSGGSVRFVVELLAGTATRIGLKAGDRVVHPLIAAKGALQSQ